MKVTVEFENMQELDEFCNGVVIAPGLAQKAREENAQHPQEEPQKAEAKKSTPKKAEAQEEAKTDAVDPHQGVDNEEPIPAKEEKKATGHSDGDLKLLLSDKLKAGKKTEVKKLFEKYGVTCLTALLEAQKDNLDAVYEEAEGI